MCKWLRAILIAAILALSVVVPVLAAAYTATFVITESSGTSYTKLPVWKAVDSKYLASAGYTLPDARDVHIETAAGASLPRMVADDRVLTVTDVPASSNTNLVYTTNNTPADFSIITGLGGNVTVADAGALEPGANFQFDYTGYVDVTAGTNRYLVSKYGAVVLTVSPTTSGTVTGTVTGTTGLTGTLTPNNPGDLTNITTLVGAATHWQSQLTDDGDTSYVEEPGAAYTGDTYAIAHTIPSYAHIDSVTVYTRARKTAAGVSNLRLRIRLGGVDTFGAGQAVAGAYTTYSETLARPGGGAWAFADLATLQIGLDIQGNGAGTEGRSTRTYAVVAYHNADTVVTAAGVASGVHTVRISGNATHLSLFVDDLVTPVDIQSLNNAVIDTGTDWFVMSDATPYLTSYTETVGVVEVVKFQPNDIIRGVAYTTGTAAFTNGSPDVTGTATSWSSAMEGGVIKYNADNVWSVIQSVTSNTTIVLAVPYIGAGGAAAAYTIAPRLPDLDPTTSEEGAITWGTNPTGITVTMGGLIESGIAAGAAYVAAATTEILPVNEYSDWYLATNTATLRANPFYPIVHALSSTHSGTVADNVGTVSGSPVPLVPGVNIVSVTGLGTLTVTLDTGATGRAQSGLCTVAGSPVALAAGVTVINTAGATGDIAIILTGSGGGLTTFNEVQIWRFFAMVATLLLMAGAAKIVPGHIGIIGFAQLIGMGGAVAMTIFPLWTIVVSIGMFIGTLIMERSPQI